MIKLIEISGDSCAGCHTVIPAVNAAARQNGLSVERIDIESHPEAVQKYGVERIPAIIIADGEKVVARCFGYQPEEILSLWVQAKLEEYGQTHRL